LLTNGKNKNYKDQILDSFRASKKKVYKRLSLLKVEEQSKETCGVIVSAKLERARQGTNAALSSVLHVTVMGLSNNSHLVNHSDMLLFGNLQYQLSVAPCLSFFSLCAQMGIYTPTRGGKE
jgi:hypothetical protein